VSRFLKKRVDDRTRALQLELEQRRKAEEDLAVAVDRFRVAVKTSKLIVFQQDRNLRYTWVYNGHPTIKSEAIVDKTDDEILPPEIHDFVIANKRAVIDRGASGAFEIDSMGTLGFAFHVLVEPRYDAHGKVSGLNGAAIDITELKIEEAKRLDLERRVQQSEKLETLGLLAGGIAHDFNNLLAGILGNASLASADVKPNSTAAEKLAVIERAARTASELTQQLLSFAGRGQVELGPVDVGAAAREIVDVIGGAIPKHVLLVCEEPDELPPVLGNAVQIRQVIMNLVKNGADAIGNRPGHVTVRCGIVNATRQLLADAAVGSDVPEGEYVKVEVSDDGAGMDRETLARSLEPFFTNKPGGRGIGLAVVVGAIQRHRGALFVKSTPHVGTTFQALYPVVKSDAPDAEASARPAAARGYAGTRRVLVVDDHRTVRDVICETLARAGCAVKSAGGGAEAVERFSAALKDAPFDCVVLDLTLPDGYGLDVFDSLRKLDPAAHVILTSGHDEHGAVSRIAKDPNAAFLAKPFTPSELVRVLDRLTGVAKA
jgi:signal transduction histidine kinase/ActR/RegA family two-component response regulator